MIMVASVGAASRHLTSLSSTNPNTTTTTTTVTITINPTIDIVVPKDNTFFNQQLGLTIITINNFNKCLMVFY